MGLKNLMVTEIHLEWDIAFLDQYQKKKLVPRGLRWDIHPQQSDTAIQTWSHYFNEVGLNLLSFLTGRKRAKLFPIDSEINKLRDQLLPHKSTSEYISLSSNLQVLLEKEGKKQRSKKQKKYARDINDYKTAMVFSWQKKESPAPSNNSNPNHMDTSAPIGDVAKVMAPTPSASIPNRIESSHTSKKTPTPGYPSRGNSRGRGGRGRGRDFQHVQNDGQRSSDYHTRDRSPQDPYVRDRSPQDSYASHGGYHHDQHHGNHTPVRTHNRFSPLRDTYSREGHNGYHPYM